jgi:hypothetical protein
MAHETSAVTKFICASILLILMSTASLAFADCAEDCQATFATCASYCPDTNGLPDPGAGDRCRLHCVHGLNGCLRRCAGHKDNSTEGTDAKPSDSTAR